MSDLAELLKRVREAEGADPRLDGELDVALNNGDGEAWPARVTASIDAAVALVERVRPGCRFVLSGGSDGWSATLQWVGEDKRVRGTATGDDDYESGALAILAALLASLVEGE